MKHQNRFSSSSQEQEVPLTHTNEQQLASAREFRSAEEMLRHDAMHTPVPPAIAHRLKQSLDRLTPASSPWWKRIFQGKS
jgi:hypothetical protein